MSNKSAVPVMEKSDDVRLSEVSSSSEGAIVIESSVSEPADAVKRGTVSTVSSADVRRKEIERNNTTA